MTPSPYWHCGSGTARTSYEVITCPRQPASNVLKVIITLTKENVLTAFKMESFSASFPYVTLDANRLSIRLIALEPGCFDDPVRCKLEHVDLSSKPPYEALSYAWGDPTITASIELDNQTFPVTTNLDRALRYVRKAHSTRRLWVDAVCINQQDYVERNSQVQFMGTIYKSATKVCLWVGESSIQNPVYAPGIPIEQLFRVMRRIEQGHVLSTELSRLDISIADWSRSILDFIGREYFRRLWIVQEASTNPSTELICGKATMSWVKFQVSLKQVYKFMKDLDMADFTLEPLESHFHHALCLGETWFNWGAFSHLRVSRTADTSDPKSMAERVFKILHRLDGRFESRDPKDRLFAILNMICSSQETLAAVGLNIDYRKDATQIFHELAQYLLQCRNRLDILAHCGPDTTDPGSFKGMPSWVPSWGPSSSGTLRRIASGKLPLSKPIFQLSKDKTTLFVYGAIYDQIAFVAEEISFDLEKHTQIVTMPHDVAILRARLKSLEEQLLQHPLTNKQYADQEAARVGLKQTLLHPADKELMFAQHAYYDLLTGPPVELDNADPGELLRNVTTARSSRSSRFKSQEFTNKRPFITSRGNIGIAEGAAPLEADDYVCLFRGSSVPFVLRKEGNSYRLVNPCYIHEIMDPITQYKLVRRWKCIKFPIK
jgi:heterokaryon incompatibility protein (HET)